MFKKLKITFLNDTCDKKMPETCFTQQYILKNIKILVQLNFCYMVLFRSKNFLFESATVINFL